MVKPGTADEVRFAKDAKTAYKSKVNETTVLTLHTAERPALLAPVF